jgi:nitroreductase
MYEDIAIAVEQCITSRKSVRGFLPRAVPMELIERLLAIAAFAPSGSNIQPWKVHVVTGECRDRLSAALLEAYHSSTPEQREYDYYPTTWRSPYIERRRATGWGLYGTLGIEKGDKQAMSRQLGKNYEFFGAPCVLFFTIDDDLGKGSWLDYGTFLQSFMIAATSHGLGTCPQAALANYPDLVKRHLDIPANQVVICGISVGYEDADEVANQFRPDRIDISDFVTLHREC